MNEVEGLINWIQEMITTFRSLLKREFPGDNLELIPYYDLSNPIQVSVLWLRRKTANAQLFYFTKEPGLKDMDINVVGPFVPEKCTSEIESFFKQDKFNTNSSSCSGGIPKTFEYEVLNMIRSMNEIKRRSFGTRGLWDETSKKFYWSYYSGSIQSTSPDVYAQRLVDGIKKDKMKKEESSREGKIKEKKIEIIGHGIIVSPRIWIGPDPEITLKDKILKEPLHRFIKTIIFEKYKDRWVSIQTNGQLVVFEEDKELALSFLNEILGALLLGGFKVHSAKENGLAKFRVKGTAEQFASLLPCSPADSTSLIPGISGYSASLSRSWDLGTSSDHVDDVSRIDTFLRRKRKVEMPGFLKAIKKAEKVTGTDTNSMFIRILLDSYTHLANSDYSQSFMLSWGLIEQHICLKLMKLIKTKIIDYKRARKFKTMVTDKKIEILNFISEISDTEYLELMAMKTARNEFIHDLRSITKEEARKCYWYARERVKEIVSWV
ncbi:MAG: hypothetical protein ACFFCS_15400 [Candidatus Hodarchaeota archaeon]